MRAPGWYYILGLPYNAPNSERMRSEYKRFSCCYFNGNHWEGSWLKILSVGRLLDPQ